jgi:hypothetical protein
MRAAPTIAVGQAHAADRDTMVMRRDGGAGGKGKGMGAPRKKRKRLRDVGTTEREVGFRS